MTTKAKVILSRLIAYLTIAMLAAFVASTAVAQELPTESPKTAIFITSCNQIVTAVLVMPNGKSLFFDARSSVPSDRLKALAGKSREPARVYEVGCFKDADAVGI